MAERAFELHSVSAEFLQHQFLLLSAVFLTALLSDPAQLSQLSSSYNSALELVQRSGLNLRAVGHALEDTQLSQLKSQLKAQAELTQKLLKLPAGSSAVVTNGRVVVVDSSELHVSEDFSAEDFGLLVNHNTVTVHDSREVCPVKPCHCH